MCLYSLGVVVAKGVVLSILFIILGLVYKGFDRKLGARMQARVGPPLRQPFRDVRKLFMKENIVPRDAIPWLFNLMPVVTLAASLVLLFYLPIGSFAPLLEGHGDLILILYLLAIPALAMTLGGFASGSPFATIGAQREIVQMLSYEFPLALVIVSFAWLTSFKVPGAPAFSLSTIVANPVWLLVSGPLGFLGLVLLLTALVVVLPGALGKIPFDTPEAETELAGGLFVEYSGRNLALFYLSHALRAVIFGSIIIALFFPWNISHYLDLAGYSAMTADNIFFLAKLFLVVFFGSILPHVAFARLKISQVVKLYWLPTLLLGIIGLILIWADVLMGVAL